MVLTKKTAFIKKMQKLCKFRSFSVCDKNFFSPHWRWVLVSSFPIHEWQWRIQGILDGNRFGRPNYALKLMKNNYEKIPFIQISKDQIFTEIASKYLRHLTIRYPFLNQNCFVLCFHLCFIFRTGVFVCFIYRY